MSHNFGDAFCTGGLCPDLCRAPPPNPFGGANTLDRRSFFVPGENKAKLIQSFSTWPSSSIPASQSQYLLSSSSSSNQLFIISTALAGAARSSAFPRLASLISIPPHTSLCLTLPASAGGASCRPLMSANEGEQQAVRRANEISSRQSAQRSTFGGTSR